MAVSRFESGSTVECGSRLGDDPGKAGCDPLGEEANEVITFSLKNSRCDFDAGVAQVLETGTNVIRIRISGADDDPGNSSILDRFDAGRGATVGRAGLQRDVDRGSFSGGGVCDRVYFGMRSSILFMVATSDNFFVFDDHGTNRWIRAGQAEAFAPLFEGFLHEAFIF